MSELASPEGPDTPAEYRQYRFERPPGATTILLVRHGESIPAVATAPFDLVGGHGDPPLDPAGLIQAQRVAERLSKPRNAEKLTAVYVTTLRRTAETAAPLLEALGMQAQVEADLREVFLGDWEGGLYRKEMAEGGPIAKQVLKEGRWSLIPGAEDDEHFGERVRAGIERVAAAHPDEMVAVFTHGGVISEVVGKATGARPFTFVGVANGSISEVVVAGGRWLLRSFNDTAHLEDL